MPLPCFPFPLLMPPALQLISSLCRIQYAGSLISWGNRRKSTLASSLFIHSPLLPPSVHPLHLTQRAPAPSSSLRPAWTDGRTRPSPSDSWINSAASPRGPLYYGQQWLHTGVKLPPIVPQNVYQRGGQDGHNGALVVRVKERHKDREVRGRDDRSRLRGDNKMKDGTGWSVILGSVNVRPGKGGGQKWLWETDDRER